MRGGRRCGEEVALLCSGGQQFFYVVTDVPALVIFLFETEHRRLLQKNSMILKQRAALGDPTFPVSL